MDRRRYLTLTSTLLAGSLAGFLSEANPAPPVDAEAQSTPGVDPDVDDEQLSELVAGANALAFDLFDGLQAQGEDGNLLVSPTSVTTALAMTYAGAEGDTRSQMRETLRYTLDDETLHEGFNALQRTLDGRGEDVDEADLDREYDEDDDPVPFQLDLTNAVWGQERVPFSEAYLSTLADHYGGGFNEVDFSEDPDGVRQGINDWVGDQTEDRIDELLPAGSLRAQTRLVLTNAIYFMANWQYPFEENYTEPAAFTALDGSTDEVPMMSQDQAFPVAEVDGARAVDLPYVGGDVSMLVILPPEGEFESYESEFDADELNRIVDALEERRGIVRLPRFAFDSSFQLKPALSAMGMPDAFDRGAADFSGMTEGTKDNGLHVDEVYHDTNIAVDEMGTEAAAATAVVINYVSAPPTVLEADRPFLFVIRDRPTGTVLFVGRVVDAGAAQ
ncbi:serpin B [Halomicrobium zhouii]|uniref:Serpin B n=1 Tax=Halomicrobium zhouii TaxID=767519 RepID=A0A1I6KKX8_9EURY|nr:serpin family protein [Halomicrobium zhouii]SFR91856.1 serpin B [Halomicrobium zhouii]